MKNAVLNAIKEEDINYLKILYQSGADINTKDNNDWARLL